MDHADRQQRTPKSQPLSANEDGVFMLLMLIVPITFVGILVLIAASVN